MAVTISEVKARVLARATATRYYNGEGTVKELLSVYTLTPDDQALIMSYMAVWYPDIPLYDPYE